MNAWKSNWQEISHVHSFVKKKQLHVLSTCSKLYRLQFINNELLPGSLYSSLLSYCRSWLSLIKYFNSSRYIFISRTLNSISISDSIIDFTLYLQIHCFQTQIVPTTNHIYQSSIVREINWYLFIFAAPFFWRNFLFLTPKPNKSCFMLKARLYYAEECFLRYFYQRRACNNSWADLKAI